MPLGLLMQAKKKKFATLFVLFYPKTSGYFLPKLLDGLLSWAKEWPSYFASYRNTARPTWGRNGDRNFLKRWISSSDYFKIKWINANYMRSQTLEIGFNEGREKKVDKHLLISSCKSDIVQTYLYGISAPTLWSVLILQVRKTIVLRGTLTFSR